jgi:hypothetical protein
MAGQTNERTYSPVTFGGVLDESSTPSKMGGGALTQAINLIYRRYGAWGKRAGSGIAYAAAAAGPQPLQPSSGIRWYREVPTPLTQLVVVGQGNIYTGGDPNLVSPFSPLSILTSAANNSGQPASFACAYDPSANGGSGGDILIITGLTGPYGFATGTFTVLGDPTAGQVINLYAYNPVGSITVNIANYTTLATDNAASVAQALAALINSSAATTPGLGVTPFLGYASSLSNTYPAHSASILLGARVSGAIGNGLKYVATVGGAPGCTLSPLAYTNMTGGGATVSAPLRYDGASVSGLSYQIQQPFTECVAWHDHILYWGDSNNPDTLYASDINQPIGFTFMSQYGGYKIGPGDGDPGIQQCIPIGNILYVFKTSSVYAITGFDFQSGEYQFSVQLALNGTGIPAPGCAALTHNNTIIYWDSGKFYRLTVGAFVPEFIGRTIPLTSGRIANGNPNLMRAVSGDFPFQTLLTDVPTAASVGFAQTGILSNVVMFACDVGSGVADTIVVYDDDATSYLGNYAWSVWTGWTVASFIPFGSNENSAQTAHDNSALFWIPQNTSGGVPITNILVNEYGVSPGTDAYNAHAPQSIPWNAQTGWDALGTPALLKELHRLLLDVNAIPGVRFMCTLTPSGPVNGTAQTVYNQQEVSFPSTVSAPYSGLYASNQTLIAPVDPFLKAYKYLFSIRELSLSSGFEIVGVLADAITQSFQP